MIQYCFLLMIYILAFISTIIFSICIKDRGYSSIRRWLFFASSYYFILSVIKCRLEGLTLTLSQSFWEATFSTYVHYGLPLLVISVLFPLIVWLVMRNIAGPFIDWQASIAIVVFASIQLILGKITNIVFILSYLLVGLIALIISLIKKEPPVFMEKAKILSTMKSIWGVILLPAFLVLFYYPNELYLTNINEFKNPILSFELILLFGMVAFASILFILVSLVPERWVEYLVTIVFALSFLGYLQAMFFNGSLGTMIGEHQQWEPIRFIINAIIWIAIVTLAIICSIKIKKFRGLIQGISLFLMAMLLVTFFTLFVQNISSFNQEGGTLSIDGDLVLAGQDNVIVFILDMYDARLVDEILESNPSFFAPLNDFSFYDETIARHPYTAISIPYLLTASKWQEDDRPFSDYAYDGDTFISDLYSSGIDIGVYTDSMYFNESANSLIRNASTDINRESDIFNTITVMSRASLYKTMPFLCKENYFYYTGDINDMVKSGNAWSSDNDVPFYERITTNGLSISNDLSSTFRFYHMRGAHYPFYLSDNVKIDRTLTQATSTSQARGCMNIVFAYLEELKRLDIYDDTTVIITADHGDIIGCDTDNKMMKDVSRPILFVKKAGQKGQGIKRCHSYVSHEELFSTILDSYGLDYSKYGPRLEDISEDEIPERYFGYYSDYEGVVTGKVVGSGRSTEDWKVD